MTCAILSHVERVLKIDLIATVFSQLACKPQSFFMEQRASIPPGLPRLNPTTSQWQDPPALISTHRTTYNLPTAVSALIVGSGITGATLAYTLLNQDSPSPVLMLEARTACSGATGRNGGHTKCASYRAFLDNLRTHGEDEAARIARFEYGCMKAVHAFAREHNIQCDSWEGDTVDVIYEHGQWRKAEKAVKEMRRVLGSDDPAARYIFWSPQQTEEEFLAKGTFGAVSYEAGSLSAYKFVTGMLGLALQKGLNLQTETPALKIKKRGAGQSGWIVDTPRGSIKADKLFLATNGYTSHLYPPLQGVIVPLRGHMTAQRPGSSMPKDGLTNTYSFIYGDGYEYMVPRPQGSRFAGDIMIGGGSTIAANEGLNEFGMTDDTVTEPVIVNYLRNCTGRYFDPHWGNDHTDGRIRKAWTGIMGYSADGFPLIGQVPGEQNLFIAASFQGSGMVLCLSSAMALVDMVVNDNKKRADRAFPEAFVLTKERMKHKFRGRLHTKAPVDLEIHSQL